MKRFRKVEGREDKYTGLISDRDGKIWDEFESWLDLELAEFGAENVTVTISKGKEQAFEGIEFKKVKELEYSEVA